MKIVIQHKMALIYCLLVSIFAVSVFVTLCRHHKYKDVLTSRRRESLKYDFIIKQSHATTTEVRKVHI